MTYRGVLGSIAATNVWLGKGLVLGCLFVSQVSWAAEASVALRNAVESDPRVLAARATYQAKLAEAEGAWSAYLPVLRGIGSAGSANNKDPLVRDGSKRVYGLELEQPIPLFGRESARVELARVAARVDEAEVKRVEQAVVGEVLEAILGVAMATEVQALRERLAGNLREQVAAVREAVAGGAMKATEARLIQSRAAQTEALRARSAADLAAAAARLRRLMPEALSPRLEAHELRRRWAGPLTLEAMEAAAIQAAPPLRKARAEAEQAEAEHEVARADLWPRLSVTLQGQKGTFGASSADSQSIFLGINVPIYEGGSSLSRLDSAAHRFSAARERAAQEHRMTMQRIAEAWARWRAAEAMADAWRESERQEEEAVKLAAEQLAGGAATQVALLRTQQTWLETLVQGADYRSQRDVAWVRLMQEVGALDPARESVNNGR